MPRVSITSLHVADAFSVGTKFIVYTGIGMFASTFVPLLFSTVEGALAFK